MSGKNSLASGTTGPTGDNWNDWWRHEDMLKPEERVVPRLVNLHDNHPSLAGMEKCVAEFRKGVDYRHLGHLPVVWEFPPKKDDKDGLDFGDIGKNHPTRDWPRLKSICPSDKTTTDIALCLPFLLVGNADGHSPQEQLDYLLRVYRKMGLDISVDSVLKNAPTVAALIFAYHDLTGERILGRNQFARTASVGPAGRINIGGFGDDGLGWTSHRDLDSQSLENYGLIPILFKSDIVKHGR